MSGYAQQPGPLSRASASTGIELRLTRTEPQVGLMSVELRYMWKGQTSSSVASRYGMLRRLYPSVPFWDLGVVGRQERHGGTTRDRHASARVSNCTHQHQTSNTRTHARTRARAHTTGSCGPRATLTVGPSLWCTGRCGSFQSASLAAPRPSCPPSLARNG